MNKRKRPPLRCRIACKLIGKSPSALMWKCSLGRLATSAKCARCPEFYANKIMQGFAEGIKAMKGHGRCAAFSFVDEMHEIRNSPIAREEAQP